MLLIKTIALSMATLTLSTNFAYAQEDEAGNNNQTTQSSSVKKAKKKATVSEEQETENNREKTLEGSKSPFSFQLNFTYSGSDLRHPFAEELPNPGGAVPAPVVSLSGTVSGRYRIDDKTTAGIGTGVTTYTPFQGPSNTSVADPYADIAHSFKLGPIRNRGDFQILFYTDNQFSDQLGYLTQFTLLDEAYYVFPFGLTTGLLVEFDYNLFRSGNNYPLDQQVEWDLITDPYFEYTLSKTLNLRSVIGIQSLHKNNMPGSWALYHPKVYQSFGVGIAASNAVFVYPYLSLQTYESVTLSTIFFGFNLIVNLF